MSGAMSRRKGASFEVAIVNWLHAHGWPAAHRTRTPGAEADRGDIGGLPIVIEAKNTVRCDLAGWWTQATAAGIRTGQVPVIVHKRHGCTDPGKQWVTMDLATLGVLLGRARRTEEIDDERAALMVAVGLLRAALIPLVRLKDGPRDKAYREAKDKAWAFARTAIAQVAEDRHLWSHELPAALQASESPG